MTKKRVKLSGCLKLLTGLWLTVCCMTANAQTFEWVKSMGGSLTNINQAAAVDGDGNVFVTGRINFPRVAGSSTADFNRGGSGGELTGFGRFDAFLAKYDKDGNYLWAKIIGGDGVDGGYGIATDVNGDVFVTGNFGSATADFNPGGTGGTLTRFGSYDVFLAKYDKDGNYLWAKNMGSAGDETAYAAATDANGNVYITGEFRAPSAEFNPSGSNGTLLTAGDWDVFLAKYDGNGNYLWAKNMGGAGADRGYALAIDRSENVYVTGMFNSANADFNIGGNGGTLTTAGDNDVFLAKYDTGGNFQWAKHMGGNLNDKGMGIATGPRGNVYIAGRFLSPAIDFNIGGTSGSLTRGGIVDIFFAKYDENGVYLWSKNIADSGATIDDIGGLGLAVDVWGNLHIASFFGLSAVDFNPGGAGGKLNRLGSFDAFVAKYNGNGDYLWIKAMGGGDAVDNNRAMTVAVDRENNIFSAGLFSGNNADFNRGGAGGSVITTGGLDAFLVKYSCSDTSSSYLTVSTCQANYILNDSVYMVAGTYTQVVPSTGGCDSTITLELIFYELSAPVINVDSFTLGVTGTYSTYQWLKDDELIPEATDSTYTVTANGNYRVIVTNEDGCSDTSDVYPVSNYTGVEDITMLKNQIEVYPNPTDDILYLKSSLKIRASITDIEGRIMLSRENAKYLSLKHLAKGMYFLSIYQDSKLLKTEKVIVQ